MRILLIALLAGLLWSTPGRADGGRYQAVVIPEAGKTGPSSSLSARVMILDTVEGHLWTWSENEPLLDGGGKPQFGTVLIYQGRVRPGTRMGEVMDRNPSR